MRSRALSVFRTAAMAAAVLFPVAASASPASDALSLVPAEATTVGLVRLNALRTSPLSARIFAEADRATVDGETQQFMRDAGLNPARDIDIAVMAVAPSDTQSKGRGLVIFEGRFDPTRLAAAVAARGATTQASAGGTYFLVPHSGGTNGEEMAAVAFLDSHLVVAGNESSVVAALAARQAGGSGFLERSAIAPEIGHIDPAATSWLVVDVPRTMRLGGANMHFSGSQSGQGDAVLSALKRVSTLTLWATDATDAIKFGAVARSTDEETRQLLEDTVRGMLAAWRLAVQDKAPDLVSVIRRFDVDHDANGVTLSGSIPAEFIQRMSARRQAAK